MSRLLVVVVLGGLLAGCQLDRSPGVGPAPRALGSALPPPAPQAEFMGSDPLPRLSLSRAARAAPTGTHHSPSPHSGVPATPPPAGTDL
jgi:hypothetical protein